MLSVHTCPLAALGGKETGGMNVCVRDLSRELGRQGFLVDVFTRAQKPDVPYVSHRLGPNCRVIHIKAGPKAHCNKNLVFDFLPQFVAGVQRFAAREDVHYDLIHSHYWLSGWVAGELQKSWPVPVIHMFHTLGLMKNRVARSPTERESERRVAVEREIMAFADCLVAATHREKAQMAWLYGACPAKIKVIPCGVDTRLFRPLPQAEARARLNLPAAGRLALFVGRIEPLKGLDILLQALSQLAQNPSWQDKLYLYVIGGHLNEQGDKRQEVERLRQLCAKLGLSERVSFLGAKGQEVLPWYYAAADVVVMPSFYESFGLVALEAMACGRPVIASRVGGLAQLVQDGRTGFLTPPGDPAALAERLARLLQDDDLRAMMGVQGQHRARHYTWPKVAAPITALYHRLLRGHALPRCLDCTQSGTSINFAANCGLNPLAAKRNPLLS